MNIYRCNGKAGGCFAATHAPKPGLVLDDAVGNSHLAAEGREEDHQLQNKNLEFPNNFNFLTIF